MTISTIAGVQEGGTKLTCILYEGVPTVTTMTHGADGYNDTGFTSASGLVKDQWITVDVQTENTYADTYGLPVVKAITNGSLIVGKIITEPKWVATPPSTTAGNSWAKILAGKYYRIATVWFPGVTGGTPYMITTGKKVPAGTNGGVTLIGEFSALICAIGISATAFFLGVIDLPTFGMCSIAGLVGTNLDSLVGAVIENRGYIGNAGTNVIGTLGGGLFALALYWVLFV